MKTHASRTTFYFRLTPFTLSCALLCQAHAAEQAVTETTLEEVVVSGSRASTKLSETPMAIGQVKNSEIKRDKPKTIGDVINRLSGVHWNDLGNEQHSMAIRQPIGTNALYQYLEDGIPIRPLGAFNHNALNELNMAGVNHVEVIKGPSSSLYGSNAIGGAVNFITARSPLQPYASVSARHDATAGYTRYDADVGNTWGDFGLRLSGYTARRTNNNWQDYSFGKKDTVTLRSDYVVNPTAFLRGTVAYSDMDSAMTGSLFENDYQKTPGKSINTFTYRRDKAVRTNLAWEGETIPGGVTTITGFYRNDDHGQAPSYTINSIAGATAKGTVNNNHVDSLGLDVKHQQEFDFWKSRLVSGLYFDKSNNSYRSDNTRIVRDPVSGKYLSYTLSSALDPVGVRDYSVGITNVALFTQFETSPIKPLRIVAGGRYDTIVYDFTNNLTPGAAYGAPNEKRAFAKFSPKVGATLALASNGSTYLNFSQGFKPPEVSELYGKSAIPDLRPSTYHNYELGTRWNFFNGAVKFDSAIYQLDGKDTIVSYTPAVGASENRNAGKTRSRGLELNLSGDYGIFDARLGTTFARHTYLKYQPSTTLDYSGKVMPSAPSNITSAEIGVKPVVGARVALELVRLSAYWMDNANTVRYPGHTLLNLKGSYEFLRGWQAWGQVRNVADVRYADSASSSFSGIGAYSPNTQNQYSAGAPRTFMVGLTYTFDPAKQ